MADSPLHLFDAVGVELEYMIVDAQTLDVRPLSDRLLRDEHGEVVSEIEQGEISWSNELTHHVIELKTNGPAASLTPLAPLFQEQVQAANKLLAAEHARLLPTAMHPWMNPQAEMQLWPYEYNVVYETFHKIFDCRGHGWANLQSMHINLPFVGDDEFGKLHAAIRVLLPILPALAASSPFMDGRRTPWLDSRLDVYRRNAKGIASVSGRVIPEPVFDQASYDQEIFQPMFRDIADVDPQGVLRNEFLNARGAIARFSRGAIEIRVIDVQECPAADLAIAALTTSVLQELVAERWSTTDEQQQASIDDLEPVFLDAIAQADEAVVSDSRYLKLLGYPERRGTAREVWTHLLEQVGRDAKSLKPHAAALDVLLTDGCLARRIVRAAGEEADDRETQHAVYQRLADCLDRGEMFRGA